jgi:uncharacterized protein
MIFEILAEKNSNEKQVFMYDNMTNTLTSVEGYVYEPIEKLEEQAKFEQFQNDSDESDAEFCDDMDLALEGESTFAGFSKTSPLKKSKQIHKLKIQMGLSCNYSCDYCSQKFVGRPPETNKKDIEDFLKKLDVLEFSEETGLSIEFWGGEPFVYWKTMKPLTEALVDRFSHWKNPPKLSVITNGSILTRDICAWLVYMGFYVSISHDGPGQHVRGPDPFEDPANKKIVMELYKQLKPMGRISFNSMLNSKNKSRKEIYDWFVEFTGDPTVPLGEGAMVDAYDADGANNSLSTKEEHFDFRRQSFNDIYANGGQIGFGTILQKIDNFTTSVLQHRLADGMGQKCGMDDEGVLAIDMKGNVLTCQNVSAVETAMNGESHLGGNLDNYDAVSIKTSTHWSNRPDCQNCPVLHICRGSCMMLDGELWQTTCDNAYSDNIPLLALSIEKITGGYIPYYINSDVLPDDRKDIWGTMLQHEEKNKRKVIPIKVVNEKVKFEDVEVYTQAKVSV